MQSEELFQTEQHPMSRRNATIEDDGICAWLYLTEPATTRPIADVWVYNRIESPPMEQIPSFRPSPPPAAAGYASEMARLLTPLQSNWTFIWSSNGDSVALFRDDEPHAFILAGQKLGYCRLLVKDGPWGKIWDEKVFEATFQSIGK
jgi:hypothetical protein